MNRFNSDSKFDSLWSVNRSVEALTDVFFLIKAAPRDSNDIELYLELAEKEPERLKNSLRGPFCSCENLQNLQASTSPVLQIADFTRLVRGRGRGPEPEFNGY